MTMATIVHGKSSITGKVEPCTMFETEAEARKCMDGWPADPDLFFVVTKGFGGWAGWFIAVWDAETIKQIGAL
jgi:hypothetical protein